MTAADVLVTVLVVVAALLVAMALIGFFGRGDDSRWEARMSSR